jgi:hypothetical protein
MLIAVLAMSVTNLTVRSVKELPSYLLQIFYAGGASAAFFIIMAYQYMVDEDYAPF